MTTLQLLPGEGAERARVCVCVCGGGSLHGLPLATMFATCGNIYCLLLCLLLATILLDVQVSSGPVVIMPLHPCWALRVVGNQCKRADVHTACRARSHVASVCDPGWMEPGLGQFLFVGGGSCLGDACSQRVPMVRGGCSCSVSGETTAPLGDTGEGSGALSEHPAGLRGGRSPRLPLQRL